MRHLLLTIGTATTLIAACGGASDSATTSPVAEEVTAPTEITVPATDPMTDPATIPETIPETIPVGDTGAPDTTVVVDDPGAVPFEASFESRLDAAGIAWNGDIASILAPPSGVLSPDIVTGPAEPIAAYGSPGEAWWGVLVAENPQDAYFLTHQMPTATSYRPTGRVIQLRGAIAGWTDDDSVTVAGLPGEQQAQLEPIAGCVAAALESDAAHRTEIDGPPADTVELDGAMQDLLCDTPGCEIVANETHFTVPAGGGAGMLTGSASYSIAAPAADGTPGCTFTLTRTFTYEGTVDETPTGTSVSSARIGFREAFSSGATAASDPAWPGRVLASGTIDLSGTATPDGCTDNTSLTDLPATFVGYYAPEPQVLSGTWTQGPSGPSYLWAIGAM